MNKQDFDTYDKIQRGEIDSQISNIVFSDKGEDPYQISPPKIDKRNALESSFEDLDSDDESVFNVYWEEFEQREKRRTQRSLQILHDPMMLLEKLKSYSKNMYKNLSPDDKSQLLSQIERFLDEGVTPLQKYYDELKSEFNVPSTNLLNFEREQFRKQIGMIRRAQKKELEQVKYMAGIKARKIIEELVDHANATVKKEMINIIKQFNGISKDLFNKEQTILKSSKMMREQEILINDLRLCLFQSVSKQALEKSELEKMDRWLDSDTSLYSNEK